MVRVALRRLLRSHLPVSETCTVGGEKEKGGTVKANAGHVGEQANTVINSIERTEWEKKDPRAAGGRVKGGAACRRRRAHRPTWLWRPQPAAGTAPAGSERGGGCRFLGPVACKSPRTKRRNEPNQALRSFSDKGGQAETGTAYAERLYPSCRTRSQVERPERARATAPTSRAHQAPQACIEIAKSAKLADNKRAILG